MKSYHLPLLILLTWSNVLLGQSPQGFQYQAVIRDFNGDPLFNTAVRFRFSIEHLSGNPVYYQETQQTSSNALGGIQVVIGNGTVAQGNFQLINWKDSDIRLRVEMDPTGGENYGAFGTTTLQSVPYALYADKAGVLIDENGNDWSPEDDNDQQTLIINGNQLAISNGNAVTLPSSGGGDNWGSQNIETEPELTGDGTLQFPLGIARQGAGNGDVLKWNGNAWTPQSDNGQIYMAGDGISINGNVISNNGDDDNTPTNELQNLSINGSQLDISNGNSVNLPTYSEGTGIDINGNIISAMNTQAMWNANQLQNRALSANAPSNGQVLKWDGVNWAPGTDNGGNYTEGTGINISGSVISAENTTAQWNANQLMDFPISNSDPVIGQYLQYIPPTIGGTAAWRGAAAPSQYWSQSGGNIHFNSGNVGFGVTVPLERIHVFDEGKIRMDDQTFGKWASVSLEFSSNLVPEVDDSRDLGVGSRRWGAVWAVDGTINTSDAREKTNIHELEYGLDDIMKLRPVSYSWISRPESGTKLGLLAQEVEAIMPEVVVNPIRHPEKLESEEAGANRLGIYYADLIPVLIKAIQEQEEKIIQLQAEVEQLKKQ